MNTAGLVHPEPTASPQSLPTVSPIRRDQGRSTRRVPCRAHARATICTPSLGAVVVVLLALLSACSSESGKPAETKPEVKTPELITARSAFQKLYVAAHGWNADAKPYRIESVATSDGNGQDGKWAIWRGNFASVAHNSQKLYTWSGSTASGAPEQGLTPAAEESYSPSNASTIVFDMAFLKIDSDQALAAAQKHGGDKILETDPKTPVTYMCDWNHNTNKLVWHVMYGETRKDAKLTVAVDASTGEFIRVEK